MSVQRITVLSQVFGCSFIKFGTFSSMKPFLSPGRLVVSSMTFCLALSAQAESRHHALIIGVDQYIQASGADPLLGVPKDMETARKMAQAMGVSADRIAELRDARLRGRIRFKASNRKT